MFRQTVAVPLLLLAITGCASTSAVKLGTGSTRVPVAWESVAVYREASQVPGRYEEIALLNSKGQWGWGNEGTLFNSMKKSAAARGANGIILDSVSEPSAGAKVAGAFLGVGAERKGKAIAVYVYPPADSAATTQKN